MKLANMAYFISRMQGLVLAMTVFAVCVVCESRLLLHKADHEVLELVKTTETFDESVDGSLGCGGSRRDKRKLLLEMIDEGMIDMPNMTNMTNSTQVTMQSEPLEMDCGNSQNLPGGWQKVNDDSSLTDSFAQQILSNKTSDICGTLQSKGLNCGCNYTMKRVVSACSQVVAGMNYKLAFVFDGPCDSYSAVTTFYVPLYSQDPDIKDFIISYAYP